MKPKPTIYFERYTVYREIFTPFALVVIGRIKDWAKTRFKLSLFKQTKTVFSEEERKHRRAKITLFIVYTCICHKP